MTPFFVIIFWLGISSLATASTNFTLVYEWPDKWDYEWPSEANWTEEGWGEIFYPDITEPKFMALYGSRIFFVIQKNDAIPVSLVSLPTTSASPAPPKLTSFPSWDMHEFGNCNKIEVAKGLEVDSVGRLWVLDNGSKKCNSKILTIDLTNNDQPKLIHQFSFYGDMQDLVLDKTPNETFAYISRWYEQNIVVFSLERNQSWTVGTPGINVLSIALSPKDQEPRQLYLGQWNSNKLHSISVDALRSGTQTTNPKLIGNWSAKPYRMLMDNHGIIYANFFNRNYINSWNTSQPFLEQRFFEIDELELFLPFNIALNQNGTIWVTAIDIIKEKPRYRLLKAAVGEPSFEDSSVKSSTPDEKNASTEVQESSTQTDKLHQYRLFIVILICSNVFTVILFILIILRQKTNNSIPPNTKEAHKTTIFQDKSVKYHKFHDSVNSLYSSPDLEAVEISQK